MLRLLIALVFLICALLAEGADDPLQLIPLTNPWLKVRSRERGVPEVDENTRQLMIAELYAARESVPLSLTFGMRIDVLLLDLGDRPTIERYLDSGFGHGGNGVGVDVLFASRQPSIITALGPVLMIEESAEPTVNGEKMVVPRSFGASQLCLGLIKRCPEFAEPAKQWARELSGSAKPRVALRGEVRTFWQQNAALLAAKNFAAVRPPILPPELMTNLPPVKASVPAAALPPAMRMTPRQPTNAAPSSSKPSGSTSAIATATPDRTGATPVWPWVALLAASVGGWLWWRARSA